MSAATMATMASFGAAASASTPWLMYAGLGMSALSGVGSMLKQNQEIDASARAANYQAQVARNAQAVGEWQANDALARGKIAQQKQDMLGELKFGSAEAALASQGTDLSGSAADILGDVKATNKLDSLTIGANAEREAFSHKVAALGAGSEASFASSRASALAGSEPLAMATTMIGTAGTVATKWYGYSKGIYV